jgi:methylated-DNA-[protein]-cysteine S-methyltransferase
MAALGFTLFDTPIGACGLVWGAHGLVGALLPEADAGATRLRARRRFGGALETTPPIEIEHVATRVVALLQGQPDDLLDLELDLSAVPHFNRRVYAIARSIRPGTTLTYGEVAARLGAPHAARAVGQALGANPFPIIVPCHRVLAAGGKAGGFSANGGTRTKLRLLQIEGAPLGAGPGLFDPPPPARG